MDVLVACPGRLADHLSAGHANLDTVEISVLVRTRIGTRRRGR